MAKSFQARVLSTATKSLTLAALLIFNSASAEDNLLLPSYNAIYETTIKGFNIDGYRSLRRDEQGIYRLNMKAKALLMSFNEESYFALSDSGTLIPHSYKYTFKKPIGRDKVQTIAFDWNDMMVIGNNKKPWQVPLEHGMTDRLNVLTALRLHMLRNGQADYHANIVDKGQLKSYTLTFNGQEQLNTPLGKIDTVLMSRDDEDRKSYFWLAPAWNYQLVRFVQEESDGDRYELNLKHLEFAPGEVPSAPTMESTEA